MTVRDPLSRLGVRVIAAIRLRLQRPLFAPTPLSLPLALAFAAAATAGTLAVRLALDGVLSGRPTLVIFTLPIVMSAYFGGVRAGLFATGVSYAWASYFLLPPIHSFGVASGADRWQQTFVVLAGVVISVAIEAMHRARHRADIAMREHRRVEEALRLTTPLQTAIFNSANFSCIATDLAGVIQIFNVGAERMFGYASAEMVNKATPVTIHDVPELAARAAALSLEFGVPIAPGFEALVFKASRGIEDFHEVTKVRKDGSRFPALVSITALRDARGVVIGYLFIGTDNTARWRIEEERRRAEESHRASEVRYRTLFECAPDGIVIADGQSTYLDANGSMCRMLGYTRDELIGLHASDIVAEQEIGHIEPALEAIKDHNVYHREWQFVRKDGTAFDAEVIVTTMPDGNLLGMIRDVTDRKRADQALHQQNVALADASRLKSEFLANMSHELRTPLNAIIGFSEVLRDGLIGEMTEQQRRFIGDIFGSGTHLLSLINDILDLSKVEAGKMTLDLEEMTMVAVAANSLSILHEKAASHRIRVDVDIPEHLGPILADVRKVRQIVYNLLSNAVKFTSEFGNVTLRASRVSRGEVGRLSGHWRGRNFPLARSEWTEFLQINVTDSGIGISPQGMDRLFKPFSQVDSGLARRFEGTGLGLAMVKILAELHGGTVAVESAEGQGSRFTVWLPFRLVEQDGPSPPATEAHVVDQAAGGARTALVVEGDPTSAHLMRMQLEAEGFAVLHAASAEAGLALAMQQPVALIALDVVQPDMSGWEFLSRIMRMSDLHRVPVVLTAIAADCSRGFALGAAAVIQKPIARAGLFEALTGMGLLPVGIGHTLRVLVVDDDPKTVALVASELKGAASVVLRAHGGTEAIEVARRELPDVIVLDLMMPEVNGIDVVEALQERPDTSCIPIVVVTAEEITGEDRSTLDGAVTAIAERVQFDAARFGAEVRRAMSGRDVAV